MVVVVVVVVVVGGVGGGMVTTGGAATTGSVLGAGDRVALRQRLMVETRRGGADWDQAGCQATAYSTQRSYSLRERA